MVKYYIHDLDKLLSNIDSNNKAIVNVIDRNVIEINDVKEIQGLVESIKKHEYIKDEKIKKYFEEHLPELAKQIKDIPINLHEFKVSMRNVFSELPDSVFEDLRIIKVMSKSFNFVIQKNEINFLIMNIQNRKLEYDDSYRYKKIYESYYRTIKLNHNIDSYYLFLNNSQALLERMILKEILFSEDRIPRKFLNTVFAAVNLSGKGLADFRFALNTIQGDMKAEDVFIRRTNIPVPNGYRNESLILTNLIKEKMVDLDNRIGKMVERKKLIQEKYHEKRGIFTVEDAKTLFWELFKKGIGIIV